MSLISYLIPVTLLDAKNPGSPEYRIPPNSGSLFKKKVRPPTLLQFQLQIIEKSLVYLEQGRFYLAARVQLTFGRLCAVIIWPPLYSK